MSTEASALQVVVFVLDGQRYAFPLATVQQVLPMVAPAPLPEAPPIALGVINLHGLIVPMLDIRRRLGLPPREYGPADRLVVARSSRRLLAIPVDEALGVTEVMMDSIVPPETIFPGIGRVAGVAPLADGLLFIHDLDSFLSLDEEQGLTAALEEPRG